MSKRHTNRWSSVWKVFLLDLISSILILAVIQNFFLKGLVFQNPSILYLLLLLVPAYLFFIQDHKVILSQLESHRHSKRHSYKFLALKFCFIGLLFGASDPVIGIENTTIASKEGDIMVCLDLSRSMDVKDIEGISRLEAGRHLLKALVSKLSGQRIGLCIFAQNAMIELPLTRDYDRFKLMVSEVNTDHFSNQGTDVGGALQTAKGTFESEKLNNVILLLTDGEDHEPESNQIYDSIANSNIKLISVAIGSKSGGPLLKPGTASMRLDDAGNLILSKVNLSFVKNLSELTNGVWFHAEERYPATDFILTEINLSSNGYLRDLTFKIERRLYYIPLLLALASFCLYVLFPLLFKKPK
ncbi:MAG: VWA domain-containing protein [Crocinitomicaceae bacterium]|mgnify:FL=1|jgi:Ca-activated chloride channel family protein|tara:strand:- start:43386 stop:44456 length:1071 start_codon:yes stop_codon:yes gene_type:complete